MSIIQYDYISPNCLAESMTADSASISENRDLPGTINFTLKSDKPFKSVHVTISTANNTLEAKHISYTANRIFVSNETTQKIQCFISNYTYPEGGDRWYDIGPGFDNQGWYRPGWEVVAFKNEADTQRVGFYIDNTKRTTEIRFRSFSDVDIVHSG
ncbi:hypothetical protein BDZ94DRAFT_160844 [Collybia nuda]|uniref:Uncharacterized protein n=1 Tax=Collybia nuda TaxID=64659 RepID=A0A9P5XUL7_9AGAR|nr:hypothetical protein BDZ94DRAFT_160844 [Collybia nuda]